MYKYVFPFLFVVASPSPSYAGTGGKGDENVGYSGEDGRGCKICGALFIYLNPASLARWSSSLA